MACTDITAKKNREIVSTVSTNHGNYRCSLQWHPFNVVISEVAVTHFVKWLRPAEAANNLLGWNALRSLCGKNFTIGFVLELQLLSTASRYESKDHRVSFLDVKPGLWSKLSVLWGKQRSQVFKLELLPKAVWCSFKKDGDAVPVTNLLQKFVACWTHWCLEMLLHERQDWIVRCTSSHFSITKRRKHLSAEAVQKTRKLANVRNHVERGIKLVRSKLVFLEFTLPIHYLVYQPLTPLDKAVTACCSLSNLCPLIVIAKMKLKVVCVPLWMP